MATQKRFTPLEDLELKYDDWESDPSAFVTRMYNKAQELLEVLESSLSLSDIELQFREQAARNSTAMARAKEIVDAFNTTIMGEDAETVANIVALMPSTMSIANNIVRSMGQRSNNQAGLTKQQVHALYVNLRNVYEKYLDLAKAFFPEKLPDKIKILPAKSGNYAAKTSNGVKVYKFFVEGYEEPFISPYVVASKLGIQIKFWTDLQDMIFDGKLPQVRMVEL